MTDRPRVAILAGLDPTGGAGLSADIQAITDAKAHPMPFLTANTLQGPGIQAQFNVVDPEFLQRQLQEAIHNQWPCAVKTGMLGSPEIVQVLKTTMSNMDTLPLVIDPVMSASSGGELIRTGMRKSLLELGDQTALLTPNRMELSWLTGETVDSKQALKEAIMFLRDFGFRSVMVKGGHFKGTPVDTLFIDCHPVWSRQGQRYPFSVRGTGCRLASFIAARLAFGDPLILSVDTAYNYVQALFLAHPEYKGDHHDS